MDIQGRVSFKKWGWAEEIAGREQPLAELRKLLEKLDDVRYSLSDGDSSLPDIVAGAIQDQLVQDGFIDLEVEADTVWIKTHLPLTDDDGESVIMREDIDDLIEERVTWLADGGVDEVTQLRDHLARWVARLTDAIDTHAKEDA